MFKRLLFLFFVSLFITGCSLRPQPGGIDINTNPTSQVFIDGKNLGQTPFKQTFKTSSVSLRLVPESGEPWETKVKIAPGTETVIRHEFGSDTSTSAGDIYSLEKIESHKSELSIVSSPDAVTVRIDGQAHGFTPLFADSLTPGEHQIVLTSPGFNDRAVRAKIIEGYKLTLSVKLSQDTALISPAPSASPSASLTASPTSRTPTPSIKTAKTPSPTPTTLPLPYVTINSAAVGFVNVRVEPSTASQILVQLDHNQTVPYKGKSEDGKWYKVEYASNKTGWISSQYAKLTQ